MPPVMQASVSLSPPSEMAFLMASSKPSDSRNAVIACGTVPWQDTSKEFEILSLDGAELEDGADDVPCNGTEHHYSFQTLFIANGFPIAAYRIEVSFSEAGTGSG